MLRGGLPGSGINIEYTSIWHFLAFGPKFGVKGEPPHGQLRGPREKTIFAIGMNDRVHV
jgi:hypothetical protein